MKKVILLVSLQVLLSLSVQAQEVKCSDGVPTIKSFTPFASACRVPVMSYISRMELNIFESSDWGSDSGTATVEARVVIKLNPSCDNPRGWPYSAFVEIPIPHGNWEINETYSLVYNNSECNVTEL